MSEKVIIEVDVEAGGAVDNLGKVDKEVNNINQSAKKSQKGLKSFSSSLSNIGKAAGIIGLISAAFEVLQEALQNNQKVMDVLSSATTAIGIAFNDLFGFITENFSPAVEYITELFSDIPGLFEKIKTAIYENLEVRFNALIKTFGLLGDAISKVFDGDFSGAMDSASEAAETYVDVLTGVDGTVNKVTEGINSLVDATTDYATETYASAEAITESTKSLELLEAQQTRIREQSDRDAERQRQIRDDETKSIEERMAANEELGRILNEQQEAEQKTVTDRIAALEKEQELLGETQARRLEIYKLNTELAAIEAQQEGFRSEQLVNNNALLREEQEIKNSNAEAEKERAANEITLEAEKEEAKLIVKEDSINKELALLELKYQKEKELAELNGKDTTLITAKYESEKGKITEKAAKEEEDLDNEVNANKIQAASDTLSVIGTFAKEGSDLAKGVAIAQTTIDTFTGATAAFKSLAGIPLVGPALGAAAAAAAIAAGVANVKAITATNTDPKTASTGGGSISASTPQMPSIQSIEAPDFAINGDDGQSQLADTVDNANNTPVRAYIVADDVKTSAQFERQTQNGASFG